MQPHTTHQGPTTSTQLTRVSVLQSLMPFLWKDPWTQTCSRLTVIAIARL